MANYYSHYYKVGASILLFFTFLVFVTGATLSYELFTTESVKSQRDRKETNPVDERTKVQLIEFLLRKKTKHDDVIKNKWLIYLDIDKTIYDKLPQVINGLGIKKLMRKGETFKQSVSYLVYTNWGEQDGTFFVTETAYFSDGNSGGCQYQLIIKDNKWSEQKRECFAFAG